VEPSHAFRPQIIVMHKSKQNLSSIFPAPQTNYTIIQFITE